jgi:hypothetical protein
MAHDTFVPHGLNERPQSESFAIKYYQKKRRGLLAKITVACVCIVALARRSPL